MGQIPKVWKKTMTQFIETADSSTLESNEDIELRQSFIDKYNEDVRKNYDNFPNKDRSLFQGDIIIHLIKEDYIKGFKINDEGQKVYNAGMRMIPKNLMPEGQSRNEAIIENPFPYLMQGVIVNMSIEAQIKYAKIEQEEKELFGEVKTKYPKIGSEVTIQNMDLSRVMYFMDNNKRDMIGNPEQISLQYYEGYITISNHLIKEVIN